MSYSKSQYHYDIHTVILCMGKNGIPKTWERCCAEQIASTLLVSPDEKFIEEIKNNKQWIDYATIILEDKNLKKEFTFFMQEYYKTYKGE